MILWCSSASSSATRMLGWACYACSPVVMIIPCLLVSDTWPRPDTTAGATDNKDANNSIRLAYIVNTIIRQAHGDCGDSPTGGSPTCPSDDC